MNPMLYLLSTTCTYACFIFFNYLDKNPGWVPDCQSGGVKLVVNQLVVPVDLESSPEDRSRLSAVYTLRLYFFLLIRYVFKHCLLILPLFVAICEI